MDIAFAGIQPPLELFQKEAHYEPSKIAGGNKFILGLETAVEPNPEQTFGFVENINQNYRGRILNISPTFNYGLHNIERTLRLRKSFERRFEIRKINHQAIDTYVAISIDSPARVM